MGKVKGEFFIDDSAMQIPGRSQKKHRCIGSVCCCVFGLRALRAQWRLVGQDANTAACRCSGCDDWTRRTLSQSGAILQVWSPAVCANGKCWKLRGGHEPAIDTPKLPGQRPDVENNRVKVVDSPKLSTSTVPGVGR